LPLQHRRTELALAGRSRTEIAARVRAADAAERRVPEVGAMSYMMSKGQYLADRFQHWHPHVMFYVPGTVEGAEWGANLPGSPVFGGAEPLPDGGREPVVVYVVPVSHWSDGTRAPDEHVSAP
jgi:hypothetical protein